MRIALFALFKRATTPTLKKSESLFSYSLFPSLGLLKRAAGAICSHCSLVKSDGSESPRCASDRGVAPRCASHRGDPLLAFFLKEQQEQISNHGQTTSDIDCTLHMHADREYRPISILTHDTRKLWHIQCIDCGNCFGRNGLNIKQSLTVQQYCRYRYRTSTYKSKQMSKFFLF